MNDNSTIGRLLNFIRRESGADIETIIVFIIMVSMLTWLGWGLYELQAVMSHGESLVLLTRHDQDREERAENFQGDGNERGAGQEEEGERLRLVA